MAFYNTNKMSAATQILLGCFLLVALTESVPVGSSKAHTRVKKPKSVSAYKHPALLNPMSSAFASKLHKNAILASAFHTPYAYAPMSGIGMGAGLTSYHSSSYTGHVASPYVYGGLGGYGGGIGGVYGGGYGAGYGGGYGAGYGGYGGVYAPYAPAAYSTNEQKSFYSNHMGMPNGYNINSKSTIVPDAYGYAAIGGKKTSYQGVRSHLGGVKKVNGVSYTGHNGISPYNYGTHEEHVAAPGLTQVTYTHRYPVHPAYGGMFPTYGAFNGY